MTQKRDNSTCGEFLSLLSVNHQGIYNYILMLVASHNDADDIMQETSVVLFEKFDSFEKGTDFLAWAKVIGKYKVLEFLSRKKKEKAVLSPEIVDLIDKQSQGCLSRQDEWTEALGKCVALLKLGDRQLLNMRYHENISVLQIARRTGSSFQKIYRSLARINGLLVRCIRKKVEWSDV